MVRETSHIQARGAAGMMAVAALAGQQATPAEVVALADSFLPWVLYGPLTGRVSSLTYEQGSSRSAPTQTTTREDGTTVATMKDTQQYTITLEAEDSKGQETTDAGITWSEDSSGAVVTLQPAADGMSCLVVAGDPGTSNITATDGTRTYTGVAIVTPGDVATLVGTEGTVEDQPAPAAPVTPTPAPDAPVTGP